MKNFAIRRRRRNSYKKFKCRVRFDELHFNKIDYILFMAHIYFDPWIIQFVLLLLFFLLRWKEKTDFMRKEKKRHQIRNINLFSNQSKSLILNSLAYRKIR